MFVDSVSIPSVCLVLEGGPGTLETVKSAIQSGTPAVIIEVNIALSDNVVMYTTVYVGYIYKCPYIYIYM